MFLNLHSADIVQIPPKIYKEQNSLYSLVPKTGSKTDSNKKCYNNAFFYTCAIEKHFTSSANIS